MLTLRSSTDADVPAITAIYDHHVLHGTGTFETTAPTEADMAAGAGSSRGLPYLVAEVDGASSASPTASGSNPARPTAFRRRLHLPDPAPPASNNKPLAGCAGGRGRRHCKLIAVIDSDNVRSIGVHRAVGFRHVGTIESCGWKSAAG
jgi:phosphinothricin acetyltransferase